MNKYGLCLFFVLLIVSISLSLVSIADIEISATDKEEIISKIKNMNMFEIYKYAKDVGGWGKKYNQAVFILEYLIKNKEKEVNKQLTRVYFSLGRYNAMLERIEPALEAYTKYFNLNNYPNGKPADKELLEEYEKKLQYFLIESISRECELPKIYNLQLQMAKEIVEKYGDDYDRAVHYARYVIDKEKQRINEEEILNNRKRDIQIFFDELAVYIINGNHKEIFNHFRKHTNDNKTANKYVKLMDQLLPEQDYISIKFKIVDFIQFHKLKGGNVEYSIETSPDISDHIKKVTNNRSLNIRMVFKDNTYMFQ